MRNYRIIFKDGEFYPQYEMTITTYDKTVERYWECLLNYNTGGTLCNARFTTIEEAQHFIDMDHVQECNKINIPNHTTFSYVPKGVTKRYVLPYQETLISFEPVFKGERP